MGKKFRLQTVIDYRKLIEKGFKQELAEIQGHLSREEKRLQTLFSERITTLQKLGEHQKREIRLNEITLCHLFLDKIAKEIGQQKERLKILRDEHEKKSIEVVQLTKKKRQIELIKNDHIQNEKQKQKKQEQLMVDEVSKNRYPLMEWDEKYES